MAISSGPTLASSASLSLGFPRELSIQIVNILLKSDKCVGISFGISILVTTQVMILETTALGFEFSYNWVPLHSCKDVVYNVVELECFQLESEDVTLNETFDNNGGDVIWCRSRFNYTTSLLNQS